MPPDRPSVIFILLSLICIKYTIGASIPSRASCRHHYLANQLKTSVLPLQSEGVSSNIICHMPTEYIGRDTVIGTEIHSGLEVSHRIADKRSINYQMADLNHLREIIRTSDCHQTITVEWKEEPEEGRGAFELVSLLNSSIEIGYTEGRSVEKFDLVGPMAGVRHILPFEDGYILSATISSSSLYCKQKVISMDQCLIQGKVELDTNINGEWKYEFAFRTDHSEQSLLSLFTTQPEVIHIRLEKDFFLRVDSSPPISVGHLSNSQWHTVTIHSKKNQVLLIIDGYHTTEITQIPKHDSRISKIEVKVTGEIILLDPNDVGEDCEPTDKRRIVYSITPPSFCSDCSCHILSDKFQKLPSSSCRPVDDEAYQFNRDADRLSFIHLPNSIEMDNDGGVTLQVAAAFKSDLDAGLIMFGYWLDSTKGRFQIHYNSDSLTAIVCENDADEVCYGCNIRRQEGFGIDEWIRIAVYGEEEQFHLVVDKEICRLEEITATNNISIAEVYSIPSLSQGNGIFIGGMYYEKKKSGLYKMELEHKYFENTREKMPSIRGCISDVFVGGKHLDLSTALNKQMEDTLINSRDSSAYSIQLGCSSCSPSCAPDIRCRPMTPSQNSFTCDCSDIEEITTEGGVCENRLDSPVPLSSSFLSTSPVVIPLATTKAILSKIWIKFKLPKFIDSTTVIAEINSHREILLRVYVEPSGLLQVQLHPHDNQILESSASKQLHLGDDRIHLLTLRRRTPIGTRHNDKKYDLHIDNYHTVVADIGKSPINNISLTVREGVDEFKSIVIHDIGVSYDYDEHSFFSHPTNKMHQFDVHSHLLYFMTRTPNMSSSGILDSFLWETSDGLEPSNHGGITPYSPQQYEPLQLLSGSWLLYSVLLTALLCLLVLVCICLYCCACRKSSTRNSRSSDREAMIRDSPDYQPVKMRPEDYLSRSFDDDVSMGTDDTDLVAYRDIPSHRVKIYRESMVSILVPSIDQPYEAAIVKRQSEDDNLPPPPSYPTAPPESPAPLVTEDK